MVQQITIGPTALSSRSQPIRVVVTGASGMLGRSLCRLLTAAANASSYEVTGLGYTRAKPPMRKLDLLDAAAVGALLDEVQPHIVVHAAAERDPDRAARDPARVQSLNVDVCARLASECARLNATLIYISTDYVFDGGIQSGISPPYRPDAPTAPLNLYGRSKLAGEQAVLAVPGCSPLVLRVPVLYALDCAHLSESASLQVAEALLPQQSEYIDIDDWGIRFPTLVDDVSAVLKLIIDAKASAQSALPPVLHCSSPERTTKYQLALQMAELLGVGTNLLKRDKNPPQDAAPRPRATQLDCAATWEALGTQHQFIPLRQGLAKALSAHWDAFCTSNATELRIDGTPGDHWRRVSALIRGMPKLVEFSLDCSPSFFADEHKGRQPLGLSKYGWILTDLDGLANASRAPGLRSLSIEPLLRILHDLPSSLMHLELTGKTFARFAPLELLHGLQQVVRQLNSLLSLDLRGLYTEALLRMDDTLYQLQQKPLLPSSLQWLSLDLLLYRADEDRSEPRCQQAYSLLQGLRQGASSLRGIACGGGISARALTAVDVQCCVCGAPVFSQLGASSGTLYVVHPPRHGIGGFDILTDVSVSATAGYSLCKHGCSPFDGRGFQFTVACGAKSMPPSRWPMSTTVAESVADAFHKSWDDPTQEAAETLAMLQPCE